MLLMVALLGCTPDPEPVAIQACQTVPTISVFKDDLALFQPFLLESELDLLGAAEPTSGLLAVKAEGLAHLRANATCTVKEVRTDDGRWEIRLGRAVPSVNLQGGFGDLLDQDLDWVVHNKSGTLVVETGLQRMVDMRALAAEERSRQNHGKVVELWRTIKGIYGDPTLVHDVAYAEEEAQLHDYRTKLLQPLQEGKDEETGELVVPLLNAGPRDVVKARLDAVFVVDEEEVLVEIDIGEVKSSERIEVRSAMPEGEEIKYRGLRVRTVELAPGG